MKKYEIARVLCEKVEIFKGEGKYVKYMRCDNAEKIKTPKTSNFCSIETVRTHSQKYSAATSPSRNWIYSHCQSCSSNARFNQHLIEYEGGIVQ